VLIMFLFRDVSFLLSYLAVFAFVIPAGKPAVPPQRRVE